MCGTMPLYHFVAETKLDFSNRYSNSSSYPQEAHGLQINVLYTREREREKTMHMITIELNLVRLNPEDDVTYPFEDQVNALPMPIAVPSARDFCQQVDVSRGHSSSFHQLAVIWMLHQP